MFHAMFSRDVLRRVGSDAPPRHDLASNARHATSRQPHRVSQTPPVASSSASDGHGSIWQSIRSADCRRWCLQTLMPTELKCGSAATYPDAKAAFGGDGRLRSPFADCEWPIDRRPRSGSPGGVVGETGERGVGRYRPPYRTRKRVSIYILDGLNPQSSTR